MKEKYLEEFEQRLDALGQDIVEAASATFYEAWDALNEAENDDELQEAFEKLRRAVREFREAADDIEKLLVDAHTEWKARQKSGGEADE
jgi:DNA repair ATPase RecN